MIAQHQTSRDTVDRVVPGRDRLHCITTMTRMKNLFVLALALWQAFVVAGRTPLLAYTDRPVSRDNLNDLSVQQRASKGMTNLRFVATTDYSTKPAPKSIKNLDEFFFRDENCNKLLAGGADNRVEVYRHPEKELYRAWKAEALKSGVAKPVVGDSVLRVTTTGIQFPGLTLKTMATVGCKQVISPNGPELQITLIRDVLQPQGPTSLVWIFNQLTGSGGDRPGKSSSGPERESRTHSTNRIIADSTNDEVVFSSAVRLVVNVSFPSILLTILPVNKRMVEKQVSNAINKVVERDIGPSMEALHSRYLDWLKEE